MKTILVVDDSDSIRFIACFLLKKAGYETLETDSAIAALVYLEANPVDLVITDMNMPMMNGTEMIGVLRRLKQHRTMPIIGMSAEDLEQEFVQAGATGFVDKQDINLSLVQEVDKLLKVA